jgi:hypothetical protein
MVFYFYKRGITPKLASKNREAVGVALTMEAVANYNLKA